MWHAVGMMIQPVLQLGSSTDMNHATGRRKLRATGCFMAKANRATHVVMKLGKKNKENQKSQRRLVEECTTFFNMWLLNSCS